MKTGAAMAATRQKADPGIWQETKRNDAALMIERLDRIQVMVHKVEIQATANPCLVQFVGPVVLLDKMVGELLKRLIDSRSQGRA